MRRFSEASSGRSVSPNYANFIRAFSQIDHGSIFITINDLRLGVTNRHLSEIALKPANNFNLISCRHYSTERRIDKDNRFYSKPRLILRKVIIIVFYAITITVRIGIITNTITIEIRRFIGIIRKGILIIISPVTITRSASKLSGILSLSKSGGILVLSLGSVSTYVS